MGDTVLKLKIYTGTITDETTPTIEGQHLTKEIRVRAPKYKHGSIYGLGLAGIPLSMFSKVYFLIFRLNAESTGATISWTDKPTGTINSKTVQEGVCEIIPNVEAAGFAATGTGTIVGEYWAVGE
jgi:hypothetical protein